MEFKKHGRTYVPDLMNGRIQLWGIVSYGTGTRKGKFLLRVYVLVKAASADAKYRVYRLPAHEEWLDKTTSAEQQQARLDLMMHVIATKAGRDFTVYQQPALRATK